MLSKETVKFQLRKRLTIKNGFLLKYFHKWSVVCFDFSEMKDKWLQYHIRFYQPWYNLNFNQPGTFTWDKITYIKHLDRLINHNASSWTFQLKLKEFFGKVRIEFQGIPILVRTNQEKRPQKTMHRTKTCSVCTISTSMQIISKFVFSVQL